MDKINYVLTYYTILDDNLKYKDYILKLKRLSKEYKEKYYKESILYYDQDIADLILYCKNIECTNQVKFDSDKNRFREFCSVKCRNKDTQLRKQISEKWTDELIKQKNQKTIKTNLLRYNVENVMQDNTIKTKMFNTHNKKYGGISKSHFKNIKFYNKEYIISNFIQDNKLDAYALSTFYNLSISNINIRMKQFNIEYSSRSKFEDEVKQFLKSLNIDFIQNDRSLGIELDFKIGNLAIECNGLYWHSYGKSNINPKQNDLNYNKYRHYNKTKICDKHNILLLHINEDEWYNKKEIWKSVIKAKLGLLPSIYARKTIIKEISSFEANNFLSLNHLQGEVNSKYNIALYYENEIVSLMTFGKSRYNEGTELYRFCNKLNYHVVGAASKLFKYFILQYNPDKVISYANRRWSNGVLYNKLGFKLLHETKPNYFYFKNYKMYSRLTFMKHKIKSLYEQQKLSYFNSNETEIQNMINNNFRIIFDSGQLTFIYE